MQSPPVSTFQPTIEADKEILSSLMALGASFFPVQIGFDPKSQKSIKRPTIKEWQKSSSFYIKSSDDIGGFFAYGFHPETIGAYVIDLDDKGTDGEASLLAALGERLDGIVHPSVYCDTPNGRHLYFSSKGIPDEIRKSRNGILPGVDIRAHHSGGWLVAPGSIGWSIKRQEWVRYEGEGDFAHLPEMPSLLVGLLSRLFRGLEADAAPPAGVIPSYIKASEGETLAMEAEVEDPALAALFTLTSSLIRSPTYFNQLIAAYVPSATLDKGEWHTGDYDGKEGHSCSWSPKTGIIKDFADPGKGGDFLWWMARHLNCGNVDAARAILETLGLPDPSASFKPVTKPKEIAPPEEKEEDAPKDDGAPKDYHYARTDTGNAERFTHASEGLLVYNSDQGCWLQWSGQSWLPDNGIGTQRVAKAVVRGMSRKLKLTKAWAIKSESEARRNAMISLARAEPGMSQPDSVFDRDPDSINTPTGIIDLKTGKVSPHDPRMWNTHLASSNVLFSDAHLFKTFIYQTFMGDNELIEWMHCYLGYCITGRTSEQIFPIWWGQGQNGKSVLLSIMGMLLGNYCKKTSSDTWLQNRGNQPVRDDLAALRGARLVWASEPDAGKALSMATIKDATGGEPISCRKLYGQPFTYTPEFKIAFVTNHRPMVKAQDFGTWRRLRFVPFLYKVPESEKVPDLAQKLVEREGPSIMGWLVEGAAKWYSLGSLPACSTILESTNELKRGDDPLSEFITQDCILGAGTQCAFDALWTAYMNWNEHKGIKQYLSRQVFRRIIQERGDIELGTSLMKAWCKGIGIRAVLT